MKILVTGASGFIGKKLVPFLLEKNLSVRIMSRNLESLDNLEHNNLEKINKLKSPLLIISGKKDEVVPHIHSKILFEEAKVLKECVFIDEAMHNNLYDFGIE